MPLTLPPPIITDRTQIRLVEESDLPALLAVNGDDEATRFLPYDSWRSMEDAQAWLLRMKGFQDSGVALQFVIAERQSNTAIGTCLLFKYDEASARADLGYVLGRRYWRQGYAREALQALIAHAFHSQGLRRLEAEVHTRNEPSNNLIAQLGFSREACCASATSAKEKSGISISTACSRTNGGRRKRPIEATLPSCLNVFGNRCVKRKFISPYILASAASASPPTPHCPDRRHHDDDASA